MSETQSRKYFILAYIKESPKIMATKEYKVSIMKPRKKSIESSAYHNGQLFHKNPVLMCMHMLESVIEKAR